MNNAVKTAAKSYRDEFTGLDATAQAKLVRDGEVTALELVDAAIGRIERLDPDINALVSQNFDLARDRARNAAREGVFAGVPTLIKDLMTYPGHSSGFGSRLFQGHIAPAGSDYTHALDAAGLIVLGKSATSEFGLLGTTETAVNGATRNPWDLTRSPGGSSGGAVAAVASGMVPVAHASDGGGSIRGPASFNGLFGFKPSRGRTVSSGMPAEMPTAGMIAEHCVSRSVRDSAHWLKATERRDIDRPLPEVASLLDGPRKSLRIGAFLKDCFGSLPTDDAKAAFEATMLLCRQLGHEVIEIDCPPINANETSKAFFALSGMAVGGILDSVRQMMGGALDDSLIEPYTRELVRRAGQVDPGAIRDMVATFGRAEHVADTAMSDFDVLLSPTVGFAAFPLGQYEPQRDADVLNAFVARLAGYTVVASLAGWPAMSVPLHWTGEGLPLGSHFSARKGEDALLLALACQLETAAPWQPRLTDLAEKLLCRND